MKIEIDDTYMDLVRQFPLIPLRDQAHFATAVGLMKSLIRPAHPLSRGAKDYVDVLGNLIAQYEKSRLTHLLAMSPQEALKYLMQVHQLGQSDLVHLVGHKSNLSAFLSGKRELSKNAAARLADYFKVSPAVFQPNNAVPEWLNSHIEQGDWGGPGILLKLAKENITDEMVDDIVAVPGVKLLDLSGTLITNKSMSKLGSMPKLHRLDVSDTTIDDDGVLALGDSQIRELILRRAAITDKALESVPRLSFLGILDLRHVSFDGSGFHYLSETNSWIWFSGRNLSDQALASLAKHCPKQVSIYWDINDSRARIFAASTRLHEVCLFSDEMTNETLKLLANHPTLRRLWLGSKNITNEGAMSFKGIKQLEFLCLRSCPNVDMQTIDVLRGSLAGQVFGPSDSY